MHRAIRASFNFDTPGPVAQLKAHRRSDSKRSIECGILRGNRRQAKSGKRYEQEYSGKDGDVASSHRLHVPGEPVVSGTQALLVKDTQFQARMFRLFWKASRSATPAGNPLNPKPHTQIQPPSAPARLPLPSWALALAAAHLEPIPPAPAYRAAAPGIAGTPTRGAPLPPAPPATTAPA